MKGKYKRRRGKALFGQTTDRSVVELTGVWFIENPVTPPAREFTRPEVLKAERRGTFLGLLAVVVVVTALVIGVSQ